MSAVITENALDRFVSKTRALFARESDPEKRWTLLDPILIELLEDPAVQEASKKWPPCEVRDKRFENFLFYEDPDYGFVVNGLVMDKTHDYGVASQSLAVAQFLVGSGEHCAVVDVGHWHLGRCVGGGPDPDPRSRCLAPRVALLFAGSGNHLDPYRWRAT